MLFGAVKNENGRERKGGPLKGLKSRFERFKTRDQDHRLSRRPQTASCCDSRKVETGGGPRNKPTKREGKSHKM